MCKNTELITFINAFIPGEIADKLADIADKVVKKYNITPESVEPSFFFV